MSNTSLLKAIPKSFYSKEFYREVGRDWQGFGFGYLFVVIAILSLPVVIAAIIYSSTITLDKPFDLNYIINQVPELTIKNGEISTKAIMPYYIKDKETEITVAIIDTAHPVTDWSQSMNESKILAVIGKNQILMNGSDGSKSGEKKLYDVPKDTDMVVTSDTVREVANRILGYGWLFVLIMVVPLVLMWFLSRIVIMFLYGVLGKVISLVLRVNFTYTDCVRLASVATTATIALFLFSLVLTIPLSGWTYFAVNTVYLFYAIGANKT